MIRGSVALRERSSIHLTVATGPRTFCEAESWIQPFQHRALRVTTNRSVGHTQIQVSVNPDRSLRVAGVTEELVIRSTPQFPLIISASGMLVPIYIMTTGHHALVSWDLAELVASAPRWTIDRILCRDYIFGRQLYNNETIFPGILRVTERSTVRVSTTGVVTVDLPVDAASFDRSNVAPGADVAGAYMAALRDSIESMLHRDAHVISELSGGFDSSNVTMAAADALGYGLETYGLIFPGEAGANQSARRATLISRALLSDTAEHIESSPFLDQLFGQDWTNPYEELYAPLIEGVLSRSHVRTGETIVLTGIGGDEAMLPVRSESNTIRRDRSTTLANRLPKSRLPEATIMACSVRAPMFLRKGVWPLNPYCGQRMLEFSERLPDSFKRNRAVQRDALIRWGIPRSSLLRPIPENFESALRNEVARLERGFRSQREIACVDLGVLSNEEWSALTTPRAYDMSLTQLSNLVRAQTLEASIARVT